MTMMIWPYGRLPLITKNTTDTPQKLGVAKHPPDPPCLEIEKGGFPFQFPASTSPFIPDPPLAQGEFHLSFVGVF